MPRGEALAELRADNYGFSQRAADEILTNQYKSIDLLMERFLFVHAVIAFALAFIYSTWLITIPVTIASLLMFVTCRRFYPGMLITRCMAGVSLQIFVALHIYQLHGLPEMHFFFFSAETMLIFYYDWRAFWPGTILIIGQHILFAALTNAGYDMEFYPEAYVTLSKQFFHYSIAVGQVAVCAYWANYLRLGMLKDEFQRRELLRANEALELEVEERRAMEEKLEHQTLHDPITALPNRRKFAQDLEEAAQSVRESRSPGYGVLFIDIDHFKYINDALGHDVGDELLIKVANRLKAYNFNRGTIARFGGDEFTALLPNCSGIDVATKWAEDLEAAFQAPFELGKRSFAVTASIGVIISLTGHEPVGDILRNADMALYEAKSQGRARHLVFGEEMERQLTEKLTIENDLRLGLARDELCVHYQPIVCLKTGSVDGFEALVRWNHPSRGLLLPGAFLSIAEDCGLMDAISDFVLHTACEQIAIWNQGRERRLKMAVNVTEREMRDQGLGGRVAYALHRVNLRGEDLTIEVSENAIVDGCKEAIQGLAELRRMGCSVHLDDFGTGQASLSALVRLPANAIKIDRTFLGGLFKNRKNEALVVALTSMARKMGLAVIAEGVETPEQIQFVRNLGCGFAQGAAFNMALPAEEITAMLANLHSYRDRLPDDQQVA